MNKNKFVSVMKLHGDTQESLAEAIGISNSTFSDWKTGKSKPKIEKLKKIAEYFQIPITELI